jgi:hypothetical protein
MTARSSWNVDRRGRADRMWQAVVRSEHGCFCHARPRHGVIGNRAFVTSSLQSAVSLGGLAGGDAVCNARASEAGLAGTFVAWMSTSTVNASDRLAGARGWYRVDGAPVVDTVTDLVSDKMVMPIRLDERGVDHGAESTLVTTGTYAGMVNTTCSDYTDPSDDANGGQARYAGGNWTNVRPVPCTDLTRLYCFQLDHDLPLAFTRSVGRLAFVCDGWTNSNGGTVFGVSSASGIDAFQQTTADCMSPQRVYCLER